MSLASMLGVKTATLKRLDQSGGADAVGGLGARSFTTAARGSLPTSSTGRPTILNAEEKIAFGIRANEIAWIWRTQTDPQLDTRDQFEFEDSEDVTHTVDVTVPSHSTSHFGRIFRTIGIEDKAAE